MNSYHRKYNIIIHIKMKILAFMKILKKLLPGFLKIGKYSRYYFKVLIFFNTNWFKHIYCRLKLSSQLLLMNKFKYFTLALNF